MSEIAAAVGGSKATLYAYFPSKEHLFSACAHRHSENLRKQVSATLETDGELADVLMSWGVTYLTNITREPAVLRWRVICAQCGDYPELGKLLYESTAQLAARSLADFLQSRVSVDGLEFTDALLAAHQFISLCQGRVVRAVLLNATSTPDAQAIRAEITAAVVTFLRAFKIDRP